MWFKLNLENVITSHHITCWVLEMQLCEMLFIFWICKVWTTILKNVDIWMERAIWILSPLYSWGSYSRNWWNWSHSNCYRLVMLNYSSFSSGCFCSLFLYCHVCFFLLLVSSYNFLLCHMFVCWENYREKKKECCFSCLLC